MSTPSARIFREEAVRRHAEASRRPAVLRTDAARAWLPRSVPGMSWLANRLPRRRVPLVRQMTFTECGAACLAMILSYHGRKTTLAECRESCGIGRDGLSARRLAAAARAFGLRVRAFSTEPANLRLLPLPAVVHWQFNHFLVLEGLEADHVDVVDPAFGRRRLSMAEFSDGFTGVVLVLEPGAEFRPRTATGEDPWWAYLGRLAKSPGVPGLLGMVAAVSALLQVFGLAVPYFTQVAVDWLLPSGRADLLAVLGLGVACAALAQFGLLWLRGRILVDLQSRLDARMMLGFVEHVFGLPYRFFQQRKSGELVSRLGSNTLIRETITGQATALVFDAALVVGYLAILSLRAPLFGALVLAIGVGQVILLIAGHRRLHGLVQRELVAQAESQSYLVEAIKGIATLKASGSEERALERWTDLFQVQLDATAARGRAVATLDALSAAPRAAAPLLLLWVGIAQVLDGAMSLGTMLALNVLAGLALTPVASLAASAQQFQVAAAHLERIADVLRAEPEQDSRPARPAGPLRGKIEIDRVSFRYDANGPLVLRDISVTIEPGQKVALVGRTGSGKTTLAMLLLGLYQPTEGEVRYDGESLGTLDFRSVRRQLGVVLQESFLFSGSIRENIAFNEPSLSLDEVVAAARLAAIDEEIVRMPMGYETIVAEGGAGLSGGQRQRLSIARAVAHRPAILLLDEATSHLDAVTERLIDLNLSALTCTRIVIAHRISTVRNADLILVLEGGEIVERGTHQDLVARGGLYAALAHDQLEGEDQACRA